MGVPKCTLSTSPARFVKGPTLVATAFFLAGLGRAASHEGAGAGSPELQLIEAAKDGNVAAINAALQRHVSVNAAEPDGTTALEWAAHRNHTKAVELLIRAGAQVKTSNSFGITPLSEAAANGSTAIVEMLLNAGADANSTSVQGEPVLMTAARSGNADAVRVLLRHGAAVDAREAWKGQTALMWAAAENQIDVIKALLESGADLNARSTQWPLEVQRPSNGNIVSVRPRGGLTPLLFAAREGALDSVRVLAQAGADLNLTEPDGTNALVMAIVNAHYDVAALLMEEGADPRIADKYGRTALYAAIDMNSLEASMTRPAPRESDMTRPLDLAKAALSHGANVDARLTEPAPGRGLSDEPDAILQAGATSFLRAAKTADIAAMRLLLDHGANPLLTTNEGTTALMAAAGLGWNYGYSQVPEAESIRAIRLCLENGLDVNAANAKGETALHGAAMRGATEIIPLLAGRGASLDAKDRKGRTPLRIAEGDNVQGAVSYPNAAALLRKLMAAGEARNSGSPQATPE